MNNLLWHVVDVRDLADALLLVYEKAEYSGRYICAPDRVSTKDLLDILKKTHPNYNYVNWWISLTITLLSELDWLALIYMAYNSSAVTMIRTLKL